MGNLYRLNSLFELEISRSFKGLDLEGALLGRGEGALLDRSVALEYLFLLLSQPEDYTILSESPSEELLEYWEKNKIQHGEVIVTDNPYFAKELTLNRKLSKKINLIEWGNTSILKQGENILEKKQHIISLSSSLNSKINQTRWKESRKLNNLLNVICQDIFELEYSLSTFNLPLVIKAEFGFSGRGHIILKNKLDVKEFSKKIDQILKLNLNGVIVEEWMGDRRVEDFSGIFDLSMKKYELFTLTRMLIDKYGGYQGSIIQKDFGKDFEENMDVIISNYSRYSSSYKGPISLDGFTFRRENKIEVQYMSEINARHSMGRILYELHKKIGEGNGYCALLFFPVKNKELTFKSIVSNLAKIKTEYKAEVILATPLTNFKAKKNQFLTFYVRSKKTFPHSIIDAIKKLLI